METFLKISLMVIGIILVLLFSLGINWLFTYGIIWVINGIFSVNYWDKFWYIFWGIYILEIIFKSGSSK